MMPWQPEVDSAPPTLRRGIVMTLWGKHAFRKLVLEPGTVLTFGRSDRAQVVIDDPNMSPLHFQIWFSGQRLEVRDLASQGGTLINGQEAPRGLVEHGGFIVAGDTTFQLFLESFTPPTDEPLPAPRLGLVERAKAALGPVDGLYAVMDAARDDRVRQLLCESVDEHQNLYEGLPGRVLDEVAPYLVRLVAGSDLLDRLLRGGWGQAWGFYFNSSEHPKEVRRHLRRFLMVKDDESLERLYFRYYDPRVLREFLPVANERQLADLFAGFARVVYEGADGEPTVVDAGTFGVAPPHPPSAQTR
jgi:pSer/pThr/pTyr-binding forkhead associated (FHA) protein